MLTWITLGVVTLAVASVRPRRFRGLLNDLLLVPVQLARDLASACEAAITAFPQAARTILAAVGIEDHLVQRAIGSCLSTALGAVGLLAELELTALSVSALGFGPLSDSLAGDLPLSAVDATALVLVAGGAVWGIVLLDLAGLTSALPLPLAPKSTTTRLIAVLTATILAGCAACAVALASFRFDAISAADGVVTGPPREALFVLAFLGILTLVSGVASVATLPGALGALLVAGLGVLLLPAAVGRVLGRVVDRVVTLVFNVLVALVALVAWRDDPGDAPPAGAPEPPLLAAPGAGQAPPVPATAATPPAAPSGPVEPPPPVIPFDKVAFDPLA